MALDCTAQALSVNSATLSGSLTFKQLLAALVYIQCTSNNMDCDAESLSEASKCLYNCLTEKQLLAALVYVQCTGGGGGGGTAGGTGSPTSTPSSDFSFYIQTDSVPPGQVWEWYDGTWH